MARLKKFYQSEYPETWSDKESTVVKAGEEIADLYRKNFFPEMKVSWQVYPDNIGHFIFPGCYRCHDGKHFDVEGAAISNDCSICHSIISQGNAEQTDSSVDGVEFRHPEDIDEAWKEMPCYECHTGGSM